MVSSSGGLFVRILAPAASPEEGQVHPAEVRGEGRGLVVEVRLPPEDRATFRREQVRGLQQGRALITPAPKQPTRTGDSAMGIVRRIRRAQQGVSRSFRARKSPQVTKDGKMSHVSQSPSQIESAANDLCNDLLSMATAILAVTDAPPDPGTPSRHGATRRRVGHDPQGSLNRPRYRSYSPGLGRGEVPQRTEPWPPKRLTKRRGTGTLRSDSTRTASGPNSPASSNKG